MGALGERGPVPKRSGQRRRRNKGDEPAKAEAGKVTRPAPDDNWHATARLWYESLAESGQSVFYEASDWATAYLLAESISRDLKPQVVGVNEQTGEPVFAVIPMKGASLAAYLKAMTALLVTEGDRRRARLELERPKSDDEETGDSVGVSYMDDFRSRALSG